MWQWTYNAISYLKNERKCSDKWIWFDFIQQVYWSWRIENTRQLTMRVPNGIACNYGDKIAAIQEFCYYFHRYTFSAVVLINQPTFQRWLSNKIHCWPKPTGTYLQPQFTFPALWNEKTKKKKKSPKNVFI